MNALQPIKDLLYDTWKYFRIYKKELVLIVAVANICDPLIAILETMPRNLPTLGLALILVLFSFILSIWVSTALIEKIDNPALTIEHVFFQGWKYFFSAFWIYLLIIICVAIGLVFFIAPGIAVLIYMHFSIFSLVLEKKKGLHALKSSISYVRGNWWALCLRLCILVCIVSICFWGAYAQADFFTSAFPYNASIRLVTEIFVYGVTVCIQVMATIYSYMLYKNLVLISKK